MRTLRTALAPCLLSILVNACGGGGGISEKAFQQQYAEAQCAVAVRCGLVGASQQSACATALQSSSLMTSALYDGEISAGRMKFDAPAASKCLDAVRSSTCDFSYAIACYSVYAPKVPVGGTCMNSMECIDSNCVDSSGETTNSGCATGHCVAFKAVGDACEDDSDCGSPIDMSHYCGDDGNCAVAAALNQPCDGECQTGLFCDSGTCHALVAGGAACNEDGDCQAGFFCADGSGNTCTAFAGAGAACDSVACQAPLYCKTPLGQTTGGTCQPVGDIGSDCNTPDDCPGVSATCEDSKCVSTILHAGDSCTDDCGFDESLTCDQTSQKCVTQVGIGDACASASVCFDAPEVACSATSHTCEITCNADAGGGNTGLASADGGT